MHTILSQCKNKEKKTKQSRTEIYRVKSLGNILEKQRTKENDRQKQINRHKQQPNLIRKNTQTQNQKKNTTKQNKPNKKLNPRYWQTITVKKNRKQETETPKSQMEQKTLNTKPTYEELIQQNNKLNQIIENLQKRLEETTTILEHRQGNSQSKNEAEKWI